MTRPLPDRLLAIVEQGTIDFFHANGVTDIAKRDEAPAAYQLSGVIGLTGPLITGSLIVACQETLLNATHPNHSMGMPVTTDDLVDWLGEISNQVLGRIKNLALEYGVTFSLAAPSVVRGDSLSIPKQGSMSICRLNFTAGTNAFAIFFAAQIDPKFNFDTAVKTECAASEGDAMLF